MAIAAIRAWMNDGERREKMVSLVTTGACYAVGYAVMAKVAASLPTATLLEADGAIGFQAAQSMYALLHGLCGSLYALGQNPNRVGVRKGAAALLAMVSFSDGLRDGVSAESSVVSLVNGIGSTVLKAYGVLRAVDSLPRLVDGLVDDIRRLLGNREALA